LKKSMKLSIGDALNNKFPPASSPHVFHVLRGLSVINKFIARIYRKASPQKKLAEIYGGRDYLATYAEHTDMRVDHDPHSAIGGLWDEMGKLQFEFLVGKGLRPDHALLDIGCGTLRGGRHFIKYLNVGNYTGMDISPKAIDYGNRLVEAEGLSEKRPRVVVSKNRDLKFAEFNGEVFDFLLAQSVFTHLKPEHIEECFRYICRIMRSDSAFFFTFKEASRFKRRGRKEFYHPHSRSFFESLGEKYDLTLTDCSSEYQHPRGQRMIKASRR
jgi:SAM-dependent methyltransferase